MGPERRGSWCGGRPTVPLATGGGGFIFGEPSHHMVRKLVDNANVCLERAGC